MEKSETETQNVCVKCILTWNWLNKFPQNHPWIDDHESYNAMVNIFLPVHDCPLDPHKQKCYTQVENPLHPPLDKRPGCMIFLCTSAIQTDEICRIAWSMFRKEDHLEMLRKIQWLWINIILTWSRKILRLKSSHPFQISLSHNEYVTSVTSIHAISILRRNKAAESPHDAVCDNKRMPHVHTVHQARANWHGKRKNSNHKRKNRQETNETAVNGHL